MTKHRIEPPLTTGWVSLIDPQGSLPAQTRQRLRALPTHDLNPGDILFRPGQPVQGYAMVISGRIDVSLTGASGRELLLYSVEPGQSCIQTTMGLLSGTDYAAEAEAATPARLILIPAALFHDLLNTSDGFRTLVFSSFANRMTTVLSLLERVAFIRAECRLADRLLHLCQETPTTQITHADLAAQVGTAREVVSRRLEAWARKGWVHTARGTITVLDRDALQDLAQADT